MGHSFVAWLVAEDVPYAYTKLQIYGADAHHDVGGGGRNEEKANDGLSIVGPPHLSRPNG